MPSKLEYIWLDGYSPPISLRKRCSYERNLDIMERELSLLYPLLKIDNAPLSSRVINYDFLEVLRMENDYVLLDFKIAIEHLKQRIKQVLKTIKGDGNLSIALNSYFKQTIDIKKALLEITGQGSKTLWGRLCVADLLKTICLLRKALMFISTYTTLFKRKLLLRAKFPKSIHIYPKEEEDDAFQISKSRYCLIRDN